uniref:Triosephosphate isomerase n=1 Tax=Glossina brevipalpis TaxID=37001 RepID=A0A1A9WVT9_9MUSC
MSERRFYVVANWKAISGKENIKDMCKLLSISVLDDNTDVIIGCPFPYLQLVRQLLPERFKLAALNCYKECKGPYTTGEVSPVMLKDVGVSWVLLGHSDRRNILHESDELISEKAAYALTQGLNVIICVGESYDDRFAGNTESTLANQLSSLNKHIKDWENVMLVYEPVWALGSGKSARPHNAQSALGFTRKWLENHISKGVADIVPLLYGGPVNSSNCKTLAVQPDVDGFLVGNSSTKHDILQIINTNLNDEDKQSVDSGEYFSPYMDITDF